MHEAKSSASAPQPASTPDAVTQTEGRYVVVFKTHTWDAFVARQFERLAARCRSGDLVVLIDETSGPQGEIPHKQVIRTTNAELISLGLADAYGKGGLIWWNTDYPNYLARLRLPGYTHYVFFEYDACINLDLDNLVAQLAADGVDLLALRTRHEIATWYWTQFHTSVYPRDEIRGSLNCISVWSARAVDQLFERRRQQGRERAAGQLKFWPNNEVFVATEIARAGYRFASLEQYGDASDYEWHPPILEDDLPQHTGAFLHPVLDRPRYIASILKFEFDLSSYFVPNSPLRRELARFPARDYVRRMPAAFCWQVMVKLRQKMGAV